MGLYQISGLTVASEVSLPGALPLSSCSQNVDIRIGLTSELHVLEKPSREGPLWALDSERFLFGLPGIGSFLAADGQYLELAPEGGCDTALDALMPFALGTGIGALLHQRGCLALHASAVADGSGRAIAICATSGMGKSTLAATLCRAGCKFLCDEITRIEFDGAGHPVIWADSQLLKLSKKTIKYFSLEHSVLGCVRKGTSKQYVNPPNGTQGGPVPLSAIYVLCKPKLSDRVDIKALSLIDTAQQLLNHTYRRSLVLAMAELRPSQQATFAANIIRHVPVFLLEWPDNLNQLEHHTNKLLAHWQSQMR